MEPETSVLTVVVDRAPTGTVVRLAGELDLSTGKELCAQLLPVIAEVGSRLIMEVDGLEHLDSSGLRVLMTIARDTHRAGGEMRVVCTNSRHLRLFRITGLSQLLVICASEEEALMPAVTSAA